MTYDIEYFIKKFEAIPDDQWTEGAYERDGKHCALGHCGFGDRFGEFVNTEEGRTLLSLMPGIDAINDGNPSYAAIGPNPRSRVLAALKEMKSHSALDYLRKMMDARSKRV